jgi:hypothetical protein
MVDSCQQKLHYNKQKEEKEVFAMAKVYAPGQMMRCFPEIHKITKQLGRLCFVIGKSRSSVYAVFIALAVVWMLIPLTASAQQWVLFCTGGQANEYYDSNSVKYLPDNKVQVLEKFVPTNRSGDAVTLFEFQSCTMLNSAYQDAKGECSYEENLYELNCKTNEELTILATLYDKNGNILCKFNPSPKETWKKIDEKHCLRLLTQTLCKQK